MRFRKFKVSLALSALMLSRNRTALVLMVILPISFYALVDLTTANRTIVFELASLASDPDIEVSARYEGVTFMGLISVGFISAFLALTLIQKSKEANRRLVFSGYRPIEIVASNLGLLLLVVVFVSIFVVSLLPLFFPPLHIGRVLAGFISVGYVYGAYGFLVGSIWRRELESVLSIILLTNIDVGWLQNPVFYTDAQNRFFIRYLPAYFSSQASMIGAFTNGSIWRLTLASFAYGSTFLTIATFFYWRRMSVIVRTCR
jgi:hypothetical protein